MGSPGSSLAERSLEVLNSDENLSSPETLEYEEAYRVPQILDDEIPSSPEALRYDEIQGTPQVLDSNESPRTPEALQYEEAYRVIEHDPNGSAPEVVKNSSALIVVVESGLEPVVGPPTPFEDEQKKSVFKRFRWWSRKFWVFTGAFVLVAIVLITVLSVYFARERQESDGIDSPVDGTSSISSKPILNGTSWAAAQLGNGNKVVFFQDTQGRLNQAAFTDSSWRNRSVIEDPAVPLPILNTPLSLFVRSTNQIELFYISENGTILDLSLGQNGSFSVSAVALLAPIRPMVAQRGSHSLSVASNPLVGGEKWDDFIFFQNAESNLTMLKRTTDLSSNASLVDNSWSDFSVDLFSSGPGLSFQPPFASCSISGSLEATQGRALWPLLTATFFDPQAAAGQNLILTEFNSTVPSLLSASTTFSLNASILGFQTKRFEPTLFAEFAAIQNSDFVMSLTGQGTNLIGYWINGTAAAAYNVDDVEIPSQLIPQAAFPFPRLSGLVSENGTVPLYLYHQISNTTFEELFYDQQSREWSAVTVDVSRLGNKNLAGG